MHVHVCTHSHALRSALERIQPRVVSFEEPVTVIRENLASLLETEEQWSKAAQVLAGIDLDSGASRVLLFAGVPAGGRGAVELAGIDLDSGG